MMAIRGIIDVVKDAPEIVLRLIFMCVSCVGSMAPTSKCKEPESV